MRGVFKRNNDEKLTDIIQLDIPLDVLEISVQSCRISNCPKDFFMKFIFLETLNLQNNYIPIVPDLPRSVTYLNMSYNRLTEFNYDAINNPRLEVIDVKYNLIPEFPVIQNRPDGLIIYYKGNNRNYDAHNELDFFAQQAQMRRIGRGIRGDRDRERDNLQKIIEATSVHDSDIQSNTHKSIEYLLETIPTDDELRYYPDRDAFKYDHSYCLGIMNIYAGIITDEMTCMQRLFGNSGNLILSHRTLLRSYDDLITTIMYDYGRDKSCTMSQILERIWVNSRFKKRKLSNNEIITERRSDEEQKNIISNLVIQMEDGKDMCFVGKFTRVVSSLVSFDENIKLEISFPIRFGNAVDYFKIKGQYTRANLSRFVEDSELEPHEKRTWIKSINEMFEDEAKEAKEAAEELKIEEKKDETVEHIGFIPWRG
jgi:Leucine-rich repeat (LRR) protein